MLSYNRFLEWTLSFFPIQHPANNKDTMSLDSLQFKIRFGIWILNFTATITSPYTNPNLSYFIYFGFVIANLLHLYFLLKNKSEFLLGLPYLIITLVMSAMALSDSTLYLRVLTSSNGMLAIYFIQGFPPQFSIIMALGFIFIQKHYLFQLTDLYETITDSYRLPALSVEEGISGWFLSIVLEVLCIVTYQIVLRNVWKRYQATKQSLEQTLLELKDTNFKLEKTVSELNELNMQLKQALEAQDLFVACVSHELRNPLNALLGSLDLLELGIKDTSQKENLKVARICGESLLGHINNLLDVAKINADKLEINELPTRLSVFLEKFWSFMRIGLNKKGLLGHLHVDKNLPLWLKVDEVRLQQILENLVGNAIKFTTSGSVRVTLSWLQDAEETIELNTTVHSRNASLNCTQILNTEDLFLESEVDEGERDTVIRKVYPKKMTQLRDFISFKLDGPVQESLEQGLRIRNAEQDGWFKIEVVDTGCGMTEEAFQKIFQPFAQGDRSITRQYGGTGLGLYIVKNLIEKMGGSIKLSSVKDIGTQFKILLPLKRLAEGPEARISRLNSKALTPLRRECEGIKFQGGIGRLNSKGNKKWVLIVDDDAFNQNIMKNYIETLGFKVDIAANGLKGFQMYEQNPYKYTFVTMDIQMPVMDGITACKRIRMFEKSIGREKIPIIIVTGNCSEAEQKACLEDVEIGANYFFRKPFRFSDCKICVQEITL